MDFHSSFIYIHRLFFFDIVCVWIRKKSLQIYLYFTNTGILIIIIIKIINHFHCVKKKCIYNHFHSNMKLNTSKRNIHYIQQKLTLTINITTPKKDILHWKGIHKKIFKCWCAFLTYRYWRFQWLEYSFSSKPLLKILLENNQLLIIPLNVNYNKE